MNYRFRLLQVLSFALGTVTLSACDWADSTGNQDGIEPATEVFLEDTPVGGAILLPENVQVGITARRDTTGADGQIFTWSDAPLQEGKLDVCSNLNGFNSQLAAESLLDACTVATECRFKIELDETENAATKFRLRSPVLQASVGLRYALTVEDSTGATSTEEFDFCLIAVNEKPIANDDTFVVIEGTRLVVDASGVNLLSNDSDDIDVSNTEYRILAQPSKAPEFAANFELGPDGDGSFTYESNLTDIRTDQLDSFEYELSDGVNDTAVAQVKLRIVASNQAPELIDPIPVLLATEGEVFAENLALYFLDPEDNDLTFSFVEDDDFPSGGSLMLDENGLFSGIPAGDDVGSYVLTLVASDGGRETEATVTLEVDVAPVVFQNNASEYD